MSDADAAGVARLVSIAGRLKRVKRTGWLDRGVPPDRAESVADHIFRTALLAWLAAAADPALDRDRVLTLALIHDLAEAISGDPAPYGADDLPPESDREARRAFFSIRHLRSAEDAAAKHAAEQAAIVEMLEPLPFGLRDELHEMWEAYEGQASPEARFVKEADRLEAYLQSREYVQDDPDLPVAGFADMAAREVHHPALTAVRDSFVALPPDERA
ncbi:MAG: HD domain-containing protein [Chloroflexia bacterium]|nr:HD domain-containing protein [Chloroflexia bacterium]